MIGWAGNGGDLRVQLWITKGDEDEEEEKEACVDRLQNDGSHAMWTKAQP